MLSNNIYRFLEMSTRYYQKVYLKAFTVACNETCKNSGNVGDRFQEFLSQSFMRPWVDRAETYSHLMPITWLLHEKSSLMDSIPHSLSIDQIFKNISGYSSPLIADSVRREIAPFL
jgi:hypothetical protein